MTKSLWILLFLWVLITALTEMDHGQETAQKPAGKAIILPGEPEGQPGLAYHRNSRYPLKDLKTN